MTLQNLDREQLQQQTVTVVATDKGSPSRNSTAAVNISVLDVNDNAPLFKQNGYNFR